MRLRSLGLLAFLCCTGSLVAAAQHPVILPKPQSVQYGSGNLTIDGLAIGFASAPAPEDRFAAEELARGLAQKTGIRVPVLRSPSPAPAILFNRTGPLDPLPVPGEEPGPNSREAYRLSIRPQGIEISGRSSAAIFYGVQTLLQLVQGSGSGANFPEVQIHDWPSLAYRGTLVDVGSEGPMSTVGQIEQQLDLFARWKANQYYFYSEANIALDGYPLLNPQARFTKDQVREIIAYGRARHIDVLPAVELYGHLHDLFRIEKYSDLADFPHGEEFNPANPKVKALLSDWISQLIALFPSPFVVVGFDETWSIQQAAEHSGAAATPVQLYVQQLSTVANLFQSRGRHVMAYADIMVKFPGIIAKLPPGIIAIPWWYDANPDPEYKKWLSPLVAHHVPMIVMPGVNSWDEITPNYDITFRNIDTLLAAGRKAHALGLANSVWTDDAQMLMRMSWPGMAYGAIAPWQSAPMQPSEFFANYSNAVYGKVAGPDVAQALAELNAAQVSLQAVFPQQTTMRALWRDPFEDGMLERVRSHRSDLRQCRLHAESAEEHIYRAQALGEDPAKLSAFLLGAQMLDYAGMKYIYALEIADSWKTLPLHPTKEQLQNAIGHGIFSETHSRTADLMDAISGMKTSYRREWLAQYTAYRLNSALGRWDAEYEYWRQAQTNLNNFFSDFHEGEALPPLQNLMTSRPRVN